MATLATMSYKSNQLPRPINKNNETAAKPTTISVGVWSTSEREIRIADSVSTQLKAAIKIASDATEQVCNCTESRCI
jgi:hypothetical protein